VALLWAALGALMTPVALRLIAVLPVASTGQPAPASPGRRRAVVVAALLAASFFWAAWRHGLSLVAVVLSLYALIFVIIACIDIDRHLILNRVLGPAALLALAASFVVPAITPVHALAGGVIGFIIMLIPALIMRGGLGEGDVKLAGFLGLATGYPAVLTALAAGIILGGVVTGMLLAAGRIGRRQFLPYGPFLLAGAAIVVLLW